MGIFVMFMLSSSAGFREHVGQVSVVGEHGGDVHRHGEIKSPKTSPTTGVLEASTARLIRAQGPKSEGAGLLSDRNVDADAKAATLAGVAERSNTTAISRWWRQTFVDEAFRLENQARLANQQKLSDALYHLWFLDAGTGGYRYTPRKTSINFDDLYSLIKRRFPTNGRRRTTNNATLQDAFNRGKTSYILPDGNVTWILTTSDKLAEALDRLWFMAGDKEPSGPSGTVDEMEFKSLVKQFFPDSNGSPNIWESDEYKTKLIHAFLNYTQPESVFICEDGHCRQDTVPVLADSDALGNSLKHLWFAVADKWEPADGEIEENEFVYLIDTLFG